MVKKIPNTPYIRIKANLTLRAMNRRILACIGKKLMKCFGLLFALSKHLCLAKKQALHARRSEHSNALYLALILASTIPPHLQGDSPMQAAALAVDITPSYQPIRTAGYMHPRQVHDIHDPLQARILVLDHAGITLVIGTIDNCVIPRVILDTIKTQASASTGIPSSHMLLSATHTHSAPPLTGLFLNDAENDYIPELITKVANGIAKAFQRMEPARVGWASVTNKRHVFNRRWILRKGVSYENPLGSNTDTVRMNPGYGNPDVSQPAGPVDPEILVMALSRLDGSLICVHANYSLHYVGGVQGLSADYFGAFASALTKQIMQKQAGKPFLAMLSNGASGDINNLDYSLPKAPPKKAPYEQIRYVAEDVATSVHQALMGIIWKDSVIMNIQQREILIGVRKADEEEMERCRKHLKVAQQKDLSQWTRTEIYARESVLLDAFPDRVAMLLQAVRIGQIGIYALPMETFAEIGIQLKNESPLEHQMIMELANGYNGYLPTPAQHAMGGYETWRARSSYLEPHASETIVGHLQDMLPH